MASASGALIERGADVNAPGPFGNPLEFTWLLANEDKPTLPSFYIWERIRFLIEHGAINNREDPNGCVPSREWMLLFCVSEYDQDKVHRMRCQKLYKGAGPYPQLPPNPTPEFLQEHFSRSYPDIILSS